MKKLLFSVFLLLPFVATAEEWTPLIKNNKIEIYVKPDVNNKLIYYNYVLIKSPLKIKTKSDVFKYINRIDYSFQLNCGNSTTTTLTTIAEFNDRTTESSIDKFAPLLKSFIDFTASGLFTFQCHDWTHFYN